MKEASQQQQFNRNVEDIETWLSEIEGQLLSEDYGKVNTTWFFIAYPVVILNVVLCRSISVQDVVRICLLFCYVCSMVCENKVACCTLNT